MPRFTIGRRGFPTKGAAEKKVREVLHGATIGQPLVGADFDLIRALVDLHPSAKEKLAGGCVTIEVRLNPPYKSKDRGFWIVHEDGSTIDFSYKIALSGKRHSDDRHLVQACRSAIRAVVSSYKRDRFNGRAMALCEMTGEAMSWDEAIVHHHGEWPFKRIASEWLAQCQVLPRVFVALLDVVFDDVKEANDFLRFHNDRAQLRLVHIVWHRCYEALQKTPSDSLNRGLQP